MIDRSYVLVTAAHNEEGYLEQTISSVLQQSLLPLKWVIVNDGSTDKTAQIIDSFARSSGIIEKLDLLNGHAHSFGAQARAQMAGYAMLANIHFDFIGVLDADIVLPSNYYSSILNVLRSNPSLGMAGGFIYEKEGEVYKSRKFNRESSVAGAIQTFRRETFEKIGGIGPLKYGGHDWLAETKVRMHGWTSIAVPDLKAYHLRHTGSSAHPLLDAYRQGRMDYDLGSHPLFEVLKCSARITVKPFGLAALARLAGYAKSWFKCDPLGVPQDVKYNLQNSQLTRIKSILARK